MRFLVTRSPPLRIFPWLVVAVLVIEQHPVIRAGKKLSQNIAPGPIITEHPPHPFVSREAGGEPVQMKRKQQTSCPGVWPNRCRRTMTHVVRAHTKPARTASDAKKKSHPDAPTSKCQQKLNQTPHINVVCCYMLCLIHCFPRSMLLHPKMLLHPEMRSAPVSCTPLGVTSRRNLSHMLGVCSFGWLAHGH